ncbi:MAG TPA: lysozyme inhibitor LprI family protein [Aquabacterium sp.]|uniref:lysozyme inhibitor LprI family protein n=1 Tax=Aquabacterium sp. TaxID=1872578 RepID=UPI002E2F4DFF|nr:lysozyme inhibitor LprI family protein [Aquabacterium sp.]HEX5372768.1 lysozyme inhibitor LprI family protein [Aquabacterium sp.]
MHKTTLWVYGLAGIMSWADAVASCEASDREGMLKCHTVALSKTDADIARKLDQIAAGLSTNPMTRGSTAVEQLRASQRAWEQYRSSHCAAVGMATSGPNEWSYLHQADCAEDLSEQRLKELEELHALVFP